MKERKQISTRVFATTVILTIVFSVAFLQRVLPITGWNAFPQNYTIDGEAILTNVDGYYYLNAAKEVLNGTYSTIETHRAIPDTIHRSSIPPLLSVLTAAIARITGISINWVGAMLPAILSLFIAAPLFFLGWHYGGAIAATTATAITLLAPAFLVRNNFSFYDTDCLNAFFPYCCAALFLLFATETKKRRYLFLVAGMAFSLLFLWWWDQAVIVPLGLSLAPLCMALLFFYRPARKEAILFTIAAILLCAGVVKFVGLEAIAALPKDIIRLFLHVSKQSQSLYPPMSVSIGEQAAMSWQDFSRQTFAFIAVFPFAAAGIALFIYRAKKEITLLFAPLLLSVCTFFVAMRFVIFAVPFFSLGFGILMAEIYRAVQKTASRWLQWGYALCVTSLIAVICWHNFKNTPDLAPVFSAPNLAGMKLLQKLEKNAVVWSWWDQGHPLVYWGERDTISDGMVHDNERTHCNAVPLIAKDDRFAANYMNFYISRGKTGKNTFLQLAEKSGIDGETALQKLLAAGPNQTAKIYPQLSENVKEKMEALLFPEQRQPIYLFLDMRQTNNNWIHFFGSWSIKKKAGQKLLPYVNILMAEKNKKQLWQGELPSGKNFSIDKNKTLQLHLPTLSTKPLPLSEIRVTTRDGTAAILPEKVAKKTDHSFVKGTISPRKTTYFTTKGEYILDIHLPTEIMLLRDKNMAESVGNRLFWRNGDYDSRYFSPVALHQPYYQIWKVRSDMDNCRD